MALPSSGAISLSQVNTELGKASGAAISLNDAAVRSLFGKVSGAISMSDGHGKSSVVAPTITRGTHSGAYGYSNGIYYFYSGAVLRVNFTLGGSPATVTWSNISGSAYKGTLASSYFTMQHQANVGDRQGTVRITATNSAGTATMDIKWYGADTGGSTG